MNAAASSPVSIPPMPMIGICTFLALCQTMRRATGRTAGPERPPVLFASTILRLFTSTAMPVSVLIMEIASAPASSAASAFSVMSDTFGVSLTISGCFAAALTALVMAYTLSGFTPKATPPSCTFGQEMFISSRCTPVPASRSAICTYCSTLVPVMLAITATSLVSSHGRSFSMKLSTPGFCRPTLLSMPLGVSAMREGGLPVRGSRLSPLTEMPPSRPMS